MRISLVYQFALDFISSEIFPYMVIIFGLENVLVIVKAVVSAPGDKDVKFKIAEGTVHACVCACVHMYVHVGFSRGQWGNVPLGKFRPPGEFYLIT